MKSIRAACVGTAGFRPGARLPYASVTRTSHCPPSALLYYENGLLCRTPQALPSMPRQQGSTRTKAGMRRWRLLLMLPPTSYAPGLLPLALAALCWRHAYAYATRGKRLPFRGCTVRKDSTSATLTYAAHAKAAAPQRRVLDNTTGGLYSIHYKRDASRQLVAYLRLDLREHSSCLRRLIGPANLGGGARGAAATWTELRGKTVRVLL